MQNKRNIIKVLLVALMLVAAGVIYSCAAGKKSPAKKAAVEETLEGKTAEQVPGDGSSYEEAESLTEPEQVCVHVCGSVEKPGVYYLPKGARVLESG